MDIITGHLTPRITISGKLSAISKLDGELSPVETLLGTLTVPSTIYDGEVYSGRVDIEPTFSRQVLDTSGYYLDNDITIRKIRVSETSNQYGTTVYIGSEEN